MKPPEGYVSEHAASLAEARPANLLIQAQGADGSSVSAAAAVGGYVLPDAASINMDAFNATHGA